MKITSTVDKILLDDTKYVVGIASKGLIFYEASNITIANKCINKIKLPFSDRRVAIYSVAEWKRIGDGA